MKKILIIIIILLLIVSALYFLIWRAKPVVKPFVSPNASETTEAPVETGPILSSSEQEIDPTTLLKSELTIKARTFIERYGSYSSDAQFANLEDLLSLMSERLANETRNYIAQEKLKRPAEFYGLTTKVLSIELKNFIPDASADFFASCQQQETRGKTTTISYKKTELKMIFENNSWKVDEIKFK
jgi:hypothetical protein